MNRNFLLIGAGALGSRHLQSLATGPDVNSVTVVEPNTEARQTAEGRWREIAGSAEKSLTFVEIDDLSVPFDAVVIATPSPGRLGILETVLELGCKRVLCEKVLFQTERDLNSAVDLADRHRADIRVNHIYRYADAFIDLRDRTKGNEVQLNVRIGGDGMGCNLIHYLDLLEYLSDASLVRLDVEIDPVHASKRGPAFVEFCGRASAETRNGAKLDLAYIDGPASAPVIGVHAGDGHVVIDEGTGTVESTIPGFALGLFAAPRVSALTCRVLADQSGGECRLPTVSQSASANRLMLARFNEKIHGRHDADLICPVT